MDTPSPQESPAYQALIGSVKIADLDTSALRNLLWLFNANPHLIAHAQVFKHLVTHFDSAIFLPRNLTWASAWKDEIPIWRQICKWIVENRRKLVLKPGLEHFDRHLEQKHPHLFTGLGRHAIPASLWNQHSACKHYPPVLEVDAPAAHRYFELQSHLLASYAETRFRLGSRAIYEAHGGKFESAVAPSQVPTIGLAVRDLSHKVYSGWVELLPTSDSTVTFANDIVPFRFSSQQPWTTEMELTHGEADRHLAAIRRYFRNFTLVLSDQRPTKSQGSSGYRRVGGGGGGKEFRHGFINQVGPANVFLEDVPQTPSDPDFVEPPGQGVLVNLAPVAVESNPRKGKKPTASAADATAHALEASGLSPNETLEEAIRLYSPEDHKRRVREMYYQRLAAESQAQALPFDYSELTPSEINLVANRAQAWTQGNQTYPPPWSMNFSDIGGSITELMLSLGQTAQQAWSICSIWRPPSTPIEQIKPVRGKVTMVISAPQVGDWANACVDGFCMPGLRPTYRTDLPEGLTQIDAASADCFILPDLFGTGHRVLQFMRKSSTPELDGFGVSEEVARESVKALCNSLCNSRFTPEKIARVLPSLVTSLTGDQSLAWVLTADSRKANQTRMFYTRHSVERLQDTYQRAARHLAKTTGLPISATQSCAPKGKSPGVGTRFIPSMSEMRELVTSLRETITDDLPEHPTSDFFMWYHNIYVVHTHLHQSLDTSLRAITAPNDLYRIAASSVTDFGNPAAALSDKDTAYSSKARLVLIRRSLRNQFMYLGKHLKFLESHIPSATLDIENWRQRAPLFLFNRERRAEDLTPSSFEQALKYFTGYDLPANCHRAFLRYHMLDRGCAAEVVDAHFGHANFGETPFSRFSSFDYRLHLDQIDAVLEAIHDEIGLQPLRSQIAYQRLPGNKT